MMLTHLNRSRTPAFLQRWYEYFMLGMLAAILLTFGILISGCTLSQATSDSITKTVNQIANTAIDQFTLVEKVADAATPPAPHLKDCAAAAIVVAQAIQKVAAVTTGQKVGGIVIAAVGTLYQPGSAQFNWAVTTLETGCIAEVHDVNQAINSTAGVMAAIPGILGGAGAAIGAPVGL